MRALYVANRKAPLGERLRLLVAECAPDACWPWRGSHNDEGYGRIIVKGRCCMAHRVVYEHFVGPIPHGLVIDHLCRNHGCVNPAHLEPVTRRENTVRGRSVVALNAAKTHCHEGHPFTPDNTHLRHGRRYCRSCMRARQATRRNTDHYRAYHARTQRERNARKRAAAQGGE